MAESLELRVPNVLIPLSLAAPIAGPDRQKMHSDPKHCSLSLSISQAKPKPFSSHPFAINKIRSWYPHMLHPAHCRRVAESLSFVALASS